ncbi:haloacid dehalogenase [Rhodobacteraceae bacterium WD3A24]|nr:haloacid dehalogenase [Rhodobacteraceae bacterium WD3A24]
MRSVIFDLDGTLADTSADLIAAANAALSAMGHGARLDPAADAATAFAGGKAMLALGLERAGERPDGARIEAAYPVLLEAYSADIARHTRLYPGAAEAVERLRGQGYAVAICTNKPTDLAERLMRALGLRDAFAALVGAGCLRVRKPDPAMYREALRRLGAPRAGSMLVGDTITDRDTARAAGAPVALVGFGPEGAGVMRLSPDAVLDHYDALPDLAARLTRPPDGAGPDRP